VWSTLPIRAQDVPGAIARAYHEAQAAMGPAMVVVPIGDWLQEADELAAGSPASIVRSRAVAPADVAPLAELLAEASSPAFVVGAGADSRDGWDAVVALAERLRCPVWQEPFGGPRRVSAGSSAVRRSPAVDAQAHAPAARGA
jgi:benzoylformate decarboxylase